MHKQIDMKIAVLSLLGAALVIGLIMFIFGAYLENSMPNFISNSITRIIGGDDNENDDTENNQSIQTLSNISKFSSEEEFKEYLTEAQSISQNFGFGMGRNTAVSESAIGAPAPALDAGGAKAESPTSPTRVSGTNVQVVGIDEPDIVKTNGKELYISTISNFLPMGRPVPFIEGVASDVQGVVEKLIAPDSMPYYAPRGEVKVITAFPPASLAKESAIERSGSLLLSKNILVVFPDMSYGYYGYNEQTQSIYAYDVSNAKSPSEKWKIELGKRSQFVSARLYNDKLYAVTQTGVQYGDPCPIIPLIAGSKEIIIPCTDIYHPRARVPADVTYTISVINPQTGAVESTVSIIGPSYASTFYMSPSAMYLAYAYSADMFPFLAGFIREKGAGLVPNDILSRIEKIEGYELTDGTKLNELTVLLQQFISGLDDDERRRIENEFSNRMDDYTKEHMRDLERTGIVRITMNPLRVDASGNIPGRLLNQFALDEYNGFLRAATTIGGSGIWIGGFSGGNAESANDVYVLDEDLEIVGSIKDLGLTERIYSARFIADKGYLVTFRQTDPFYVLDLSNPRKPEMKGELKIPGFSSYLDPLTENRILGVGQEGGQVKLSLFDVSSAERPTEKDKYILNEYYTDISNTHHAFLADREHKVFFIPGSQGGYIFSYAGDKLELKKAVANIVARRAIYLDDYFYVIGEDKIVVFDEKNWEKIKEFSLN